MVQKSNALTLLERRATALKSLGVVKIGLFGSVLEPDRFNTASDIDVYAEFDPKALTIKNYFGLFDELESIFNKKIDLVTNDSLSPYLGPTILSSVQYARLDS